MLRNDSPNWAIDEIRFDARRFVQSEVELIDEVNLISFVERVEHLIEGLRINVLAHRKERVTWHRCRLAIDRHFEDLAEIVHGRTLVWQDQKEIAALLDLVTHVRDPIR